MGFKSVLALATLATVNAANYKRVACPDGVNTASNAACCAFFALRDDLMENLFDEGCNEEVHEVVRLAFHDAVSFSQSLKSQGKPAGGGADGSPIVFPDVEPNFANNNGIAASVDDLTPFFQSHNVSAGDLVQFAAAVALSTCPGAPRMAFMAGRPTATAPAPDGLVPSPADQVEQIVARFADAGGFSAAEVVALLASHSIARADHVDPTIQAVPFDSTPFTFDTQFFVEVQLRGTGFPGTSNAGEVMSALPQGSGEDVGEMRLESDHNFARNSLTACTFQGFVNQQTLMQQKFAAAFLKLGLVGINTAQLVDCSEVIPAQAPPVTKPATFPAGKSNKDIEQACASAPFPTLATDPGPATLIPHCPDGGTDCDPPDSKRRK